MSTAPSLLRDAARALQARGVRLSAKRLREVSHLARSFIEDGMGRIEALDHAAYLVERTCPCASPIRLATSGGFHTRSRGGTISRSPSG